jgi:hypothetical protein
MRWSYPNEGGIKRVVAEAGAGAVEGGHLVGGGDGLPMMGLPQKIVAQIMTCESEKTGIVEV